MILKSKQNSISYRKFLFILEGITAEKMKFSMKDFSVNVTYTE